VFGLCAKAYLILSNEMTCSVFVIGETMLREEIKNICPTF